MEQMIYAWTSSASRVGYRTIARSDGLSENDALELEGLFGFFGPPPRAIPSEGVPSFLCVGPETYAAWRIYTQTHDVRGTRDAIWVHAFVFDAKELDAMDGDPFALDDAGQFISPRSDLPKRLRRLRPAKPERGPRTVTSLEALTPLQTEMLLAAAFCPGYACLSQEGLNWQQIRALRYLVPAEQRATLTFYGLVTGVPARKPKLMLVSSDCYGRSFDPGATVTASLASQDYAGQDPTPYAAALASLLATKAWERARELVRLAETLKVDVFGSGADDLVGLFRKRESLVRDLEARELQRLSGALRTAENAAHVAEFYGNALLAIAERAIRLSGGTEKVRESISVMAEDAGELTSRQRAAGWSVLDEAWHRLLREPTLLPPLLHASRAWPEESAEKIAWLVQHFPAYLEAVSAKVDRFGDRLALLKEAADEAQRSAGTALAEWSAAGLIATAVSAMGPDQVNTLWNAYGRWVRSRGPALLIWKQLRHAAPQTDMWDMVHDLALRTITFGDCDQIASFLKWATRQPDALSEACAVASQLCPSPQAKLDVAAALVNRERLHEADAFCILLAMERSARRRGPLATAFLTSLPMRERFRLAVDVVRSGDIQKKAHFLYAVLEPADEDQARVLVEMARYYMKTVPFWLRGGIYARLECVRWQFPLCGAEALLRVREQRRRAAWTVALATAAVVAVLAAAVVFQDDLADWLSPRAAPKGEKAQAAKKEEGSGLETQAPPQGNRSEVSVHGAGWDWRNEVQSYAEFKPIITGKMKVYRKHVICEAALRRDVRVAEDACWDIQVAVLLQEEPASWAVAVLEVLDPREPARRIGLCSDSRLAEARRYFAEAWDDGAVPPEGIRAAIGRVLDAGSPQPPTPPGASGPSSPWGTWLADKGLEYVVDKCRSERGPKLALKEPLSDDDERWLLEVGLWAERDVPPEPPSKPVK